MLENFNFKMYTEDAAKKLVAALAGKKAAKGQGTFEVIATTEGIDRAGEVIVVSGWNFDNFMKNPIMLWGHNYYDMNAVIGAVTEVIPEEKQVVVKGVFADTDSGQMARKLYEDGILKAVSVGFIPLKREGNAITQAELLEVSFVSVPCNPDALSLAKIQKLENMLTTGKGVEEEEKPEIVPPVGLDNPKESEEAPESEEAEGKAIKSGRVLSQKNRTSIEESIVSMEASISLLKSLLDASEPEKSVIVEAAEEAVMDAQAMQKMLERVISKAKFLKSNS